MIVRNGALALGWVLICGLAGCTAGTPGETPASSPTVAPAGPTPSSQSPAATVTITPEPTFAGPAIEVPSGWRIVQRGSIGVALVVDDVLLLNDGDRAAVDRFDPVTLESLGTVVAGHPAVFPPDAYTIAPGTDGVWVALASQASAVLLDPRTGKLGRRITAEGTWPYDVLELDGDLWIADYEHSTVTRVDGTTEKVTATMPVRQPTDLLAAYGSIWATVHVGRHDEPEPIIGNGGQIARIDPVANEVVALIDVGPRPYYLAAGFGSIWTGNATGGSVSRVDPATNTAIEIPIGEDGAFDIEVAGDSVWVVVGPQHWSPDCDPATSFFIRIDPTTNTVRERVSFPCPGLLAADGDRLWVSGDRKGTRVLEVLEPAS